MIGLLDLDSMIYNVAYNQVKSGNYDDAAKVANHIARFIATIETNGRCDSYIRIYQKPGHRNFRKLLLPEYKEHRETPDFITLWKPTIVETFEDLISLGVDFIETDDAISILAKEVGHKDITIISGDKDMKQVPGLHYNPFKPNLDAKERWQIISPEQADMFFWIQAMTGDGTDMPNGLCGIERVGEKTAIKHYAGCVDNYQKVLQREYTKKYGEKEGFKRADITYKMVKLLTGEESYIQEHVKEEIAQIKDSYNEFKVQYKSDIASLFEAPAPKNLFEQ